MTDLPRFAAHESRDWCHFCGVRSGRLVDCWHAGNAEHKRQGGRCNCAGCAAGTVYVRICLECVRAMTTAAGVVGP